jgi:hypothetical protein
MITLADYLCYVFSFLVIAHIIHRSGKPPLGPLPASGIIGAADNLGAGVANFGNAQGAAFDSLVSGTINGIGTLLSGTLGSGAVSTAFLNSDKKKPKV